VWEREMIVKYRYFSNGQVSSIRRFVDGEYHCECGPAVENFYFNGHPYLKTWRKMGDLHRVDGPAKVEYDENGLVLDEQWYVYGMSLDDDEDIIAWRAEHNVGLEFVNWPEEIKTLFMFEFV
jgi:hypothetical protein